MNFKRIRSFFGIDSALASFFRAIEENVSSAFDEIAISKRPSWRTYSTDSTSVTAAPWDFVRVTVDGRVLLPTPNGSNAGAEVTVLLGPSVTCVVSPVSGAINGTTSYTATGRWVYRFISSGEGWYV